jgi:hypothetical protein
MGGGLRWSGGGVWARLVRGGTVERQQDPLLEVAVSSRRTATYTGLMDPIRYVMDEPTTGLHMRVVPGVQRAVQPPSRGIELPVMDALRSPHSHRAASATSAGSISRLIAVRSRNTWSTTSAAGMPWARAWSAI